MEVVVVTRKQKELNILVEPNSCKPQLFLSESRHTREREELGMEDKMSSLKHRSHGCPGKETGGSSCFLFSHPVSPIKK